MLQKILTFFGFETLMNLKSFAKINSVNNLETENQDTSVQPQQTEI